MSGSIGLRQPLLEDIDRLARTLQIELLAGVCFEELLRIEIFDKQTVSLDAAQQAVVLDPDLGYTAMGAGDVRRPSTPPKNPS